MKFIAILAIIASALILIAQAEEPTTSGTPASNAKQSDPKTTPQPELKKTGENEI